MSLVTVPLFPLPTALYPQWNGTALFHTALSFLPFLAAAL